jgi:peptide/nickel transport system substrate-binding protein
VDVVDPYTVRINLTDYSSEVLSGLAEGYCGPISPTAYQKNGKDWAEKNPVGTGPFKLVSMTPDVGWRYERNSDYWGSKPYLDAIEWKSVMDTNVAKMMLEKGDADLWATGTGGTDAKVTLANEGFILTQNSAGGEPTIMVPDGNNPDSPWAKLEVRLAADYAINRQDIVAMSKGMGKPTWQIATPNLNYYDPSLTRPYDPDKARQLLKEAGYPSGFTTTLNYMSVGLSNDFAVALQSYFKDVGITLELNLLPPNLAIQMAMKGWHNGLFSRPSPAAYNFCGELSKFYGPRRMITVSGLTTPELQGLLDGGLKAQTLEEQKSWNIKVNKYLFDQEVSIPFYLSLYFAIKAPYVHDEGIGYSYYWSPGKCWLSK